MYREPPSLYGTRNPTFALCVPRPIPPQFLVHLVEMDIYITGASNWAGQEGAVDMRSRSELGSVVVGGGRLSGRGQGVRVK